VILIVYIHKLQNTINKTTTCTRKANTDKRNPEKEISLSMSEDTDKFGAADLPRKTKSTAAALCKGKSAGMTHWR
jgi:hypothetical protein